MRDRHLSDHHGVCDGARAGRPRGHRRLHGLRAAGFTRRQLPAGCPIRYTSCLDGRRDHINVVSTGVVIRTNLSPLRTSGLTNIWRIVIIVGFNPDSVKFVFDKVVIWLNLWFEPDVVSFSSNC